MAKDKRRIDLDDGSYMLTELTPYERYARNCAAQGLEPITEQEAVLLFALLGHRVYAKLIHG